MIDFAHRTGLLNSSNPPRRYLWTDAFAVCALLSLFDVTRDQEFLDLATLLINQVHETLGRHRQDDTRIGWISELDEDEARRHPTIGGLRIGKQSNERAPGKALDDLEEWDRDGQYFHYLTKWMHALERAAVVTSDATYCRWALELAQAAHMAFTHRAADGGTQRMYWKMSIDLSRPLVTTMGHHDPLDALVTYSELEQCRMAHFSDAELPNLQSQTDDVAAMCTGRTWVTDDPLGIGGLLFDIYRISQLQTRGSTAGPTELEGILTDAREGLAIFNDRYPIHARADIRLAFRELGLSIGLHAIEALQEDLVAGQVSISSEAARELAKVIQFAPAAKGIEAFWRSPEHRLAATWLDHIDINSVMLASSLLPRQFLLI